MKHLIFLLAVLFPLMLFGQSVSRTELRNTNNALITRMDSRIDSATNQSYAYTRSQLVLSNSLFIRGPASATDNAIARFDATTGKLIKDSAVIIDVTGSNVTGIHTMTLNSYLLLGGSSGSIYMRDDSTFITMGTTDDLRLLHPSAGVLGLASAAGASGTASIIASNGTFLGDVTVIGGINAASTPPQFVVNGTTGGLNIGGGEAVLNPGSLVLNMAGPPGVTIINSDISPTDPQFSITQSGAFSLLTNKGPIYGSAFIGSGSGVGKLTLADEDGTLISQFYTNSSFGITNIYQYSANILAGDCWKIKSTNNWQIFWTNGPCGSGGGSVAGNSGAIQFNEGGAFAGTNKFKYDRTNQTIINIGFGGFRNEDPNVLSTNALDWRGVGSDAAGSFGIFSWGTNRWNINGSAASLGSLVPVVNNAYDIGTPSFAVRTNYSGSFVAVGGGTNVFGDTIFTNSISARTNIAMVDVSTNLINSGQKYTQGARRVFVTASAQLTAAVAGTAIMSLYSETVGVATNKVTVAAGPLTGLVTVEQLSLIISPGSVYYFTNESSGAGASVSIVADTCNKIEL